MPSDNGVMSSFWFWININLYSKEAQFIQLRFLFQKILVIWSVSRNILKQQFSVVEWRLPTE